MNVNGTKMNIIFLLLQDIDVIVARCSDKDKSQYVLEALFPDDAGDTWPSGKQPTLEDMHSMARPYKYEAVPLHRRVSSAMYSLPSLFLLALRLQGGQVAASAV
jgi:hypothetical protein